MTEFLHVIGNNTVPTPAVDALAHDGAPRLALAEDRRCGIRCIGMRALASALDVCGIFTLSTAIAGTLNTDLSLACALVGLTYYALATIALGQGVTLWYLGGRVLQRTRMTANVRTRVFLVPRRRRHASRGPQNPADFRDNSSAPVVHATSH
jgi:hypothetical protein